MNKQNSRTIISDQMQCSSSINDGGCGSSRSDGGVVAVEVTVVVVAVEVQWLW